jgi:hypothetical protein
MTKSGLIRYVLIIQIIAGYSFLLPAQKINVFRTSELELVYFGKRYSYITPHVARTFHNALNLQTKRWDYNHDKTFMFLTDFEDDGHGGAIVMPNNLIIAGIAPFNFSFSITPSVERFQWLLSHELTHIILTDKPNKTDLFWRRVMMGKVMRNDQVPITALWSYLTTPRWYAPRWFHEGIACYMETWTSGGPGRTLGPYDEMYFRSIVNEDDSLYSVIGLETEGSTIDFQVGANAYLYGTRFVSYLAQHYGDSSIVQLYSRTNNSRPFYGTQFKQVYGIPVQQAWQHWTNFERDFQEANLKSIRQYPLTKVRHITPAPLGSCSTVGYDPQSEKVYAAINHPGNISQIAEIDLKTGDIRKVAVLDAPMLYTVAYLTYDPDDKQIFISEQNSKFRSLVKIDAGTGKKQTLIKYSRTGNLTFNQADKSLWGVQHDNGYATLVKIPQPYTKVVPMYSADFGKSLLDLAISSDGTMLSATLTGVRGEQSLILFHLDDLEEGVKTFETVHYAEDYTITQFRFADNDQTLIGTSYYTGVSNIWRINLESKDFELLSNDETGLFAPVQLKNDSLFALKFFRNGMMPVMLPLTVITEANSIRYLGNLVMEKNPQLADLTLPSPTTVNLDSLKIEEVPWNPIKNMRLTDAFPDVAGFKNTFSVGYRMNWRDPMGVSSVSLFLAGSPWSQNPDNQKAHIQLQWNLWLWSFIAQYNKTDFYDLFGPTRTSRPGYAFGVKYLKNHTLNTPFKYLYGFQLMYHGDLEVLPDFQNITSPIKQMVGLSATTEISKLRRTLGGVDDEKGYRWNLSANGYYANKGFFPSLVSEQQAGVLIPGIRNTSFWIRNATGLSFGKPESPLASFYFGGFRNNYIDWQPVSQYRKTMAFPGAEIDEIAARHFVKTMGELCLRPFRMRNIGTTWLYPTFIRPTIFGTHMAIVTDGYSTLKNLYNIGVQIDLELVLFSYLKTTWSAGYARKMEPSLAPNEQWMFSLKLLGN